ncbi:hypothetical protein [Fodinibius sp.]|uniref:hypothetical protein n=1 Tax=Fodinibius sp. TaxID=1872440 RepID=UPI002ACE1AFE|nr:hypothetical protein [Fodinibius sp.]MDZ7657931.1 hypothetical protein [Fodinibius sp.]
MKPYPLLFCISLIIIPLSVFSQQSDSENETIRVFLDCNRCNESFIRQEIPFVNYVRDKEDSEIHLLITRQRTGSDGTEYTLRFLGRDRFKSQQDTLKYISPSSDTQNEERKGLVRTIKIGLLPFISKTKAIENITVDYNREGDVQSTAEEDKWNYWVFELDGRSFFNGEESRSNLFISLGASADRVTPESKINFGYDYNFNRRTFTELDSLGNESTNSFITRSQRFDGLYVKSLNDHWSAGISAEGLSSSRENIDLSISGSPAIEYNIFPYEEYSTREISFLYKISPGYFDYEEITIYNQKSEFLIRQQLRAQMEFTQPWGEIEGRVNASTFLHDFSKNRVDMNLEFDFRIFRGLSLSIDGRYSLINDQLSIPKGNISDAEQLLNLREQTTSYSYRGSIGIEYSFGSIYNNVVNPRF